MQHPALLSLHTSARPGRPRRRRAPVLYDLTEMAGDWEAFQSRGGHTAAKNRRTGERLYGHDAERVLRADAPAPAPSDKAQPSPEAAPDTHDDGPTDWGQVTGKHLATLHDLKRSEAKREAARKKFIEKAVNAAKVAGKVASAPAQGLDALGKKVVGETLWGMMTGPLRWVGRSLGAVALAVEHGLNAVKEGSQRLAMQVAHERGYSPRHVERVGEAVGLVDAGNAWGGTNIGGTHEALHVAHVAEGWSGFLLAKIGYYMPTGSLLYVAGALAADAVGGFFGGRANVIRAAWKVIRGEDVGRHGPEALRKKREAARRAKVEALGAREGPLDVTEMATGGVTRPLGGKALADVLFRRLRSAGKRADWYLALFYAAYDHTHNARQAVRLADRGFRQHPSGEQLAAQVKPEELADLLHGMEGGR